MDAYALRLAVSFVLGGLAVATFTTAAERLGSRLGGLLLSFPVKVVISLVFIALGEGLAVASASAQAVPAAMGANVAFLGATALFARRLRPDGAVAAGLATWLLVATAIVLVPARGVLAAFATWAVLAAASFLLLQRAGARGARKAKDPGRFTWRGLLSRTLGAGLVVAGSVWIAHAGGAYLGGLAAAFPSGFITTMVILTRRHGPEFTAITARTMIAGSLAPTLFAIVVALTIERAGLLASILAGLAVAGAASACVGWALARADGGRAAREGTAAA